MRRRCRSVSSARDDEPAATPSATAAASGALLTRRVMLPRLRGPSWSCARSSGSSSSRSLKNEGRFCGGVGEGAGHRRHSGQGTGQADDARSKARFLDGGQAFHSNKPTNSRSPWGPRPCKRRSGPLAGAAGGTGPPSSTAGSLQRCRGPDRADQSSSQSRVSGPGWTWRSENREEQGKISRSPSSLSTPPGPRYPRARTRPKL